MRDTGGDKSKLRTEWLLRCTVRYPREDVSINREYGLSTTNCRPKVLCKRNEESKKEKCRMRGREKEREGGGEKGG